MRKKTGKVIFSEFIDKIQKSGKKPSPKHREFYQWWMNSGDEKLRRFYMVMNKINDLHHPEDSKRIVDLSGL